MSSPSTVLCDQCQVLSENIHFLIKCKCESFVCCMCFQKSISCFNCTHPLSNGTVLEIEDHKAKPHSCPATYLTQPSSGDILNYHKNLDLIEKSLNIAGENNYIFQLFVKLSIPQSSQMVRYIWSDVAYRLIRNDDVIGDLEGKLSKYFTQDRIENFSQNLYKVTLTGQGLKLLKILQSHQGYPMFNLLINEIAFSSNLQQSGIVQNVKEEGNSLHVFLNKLGFIMHVMSTGMIFALLVISCLNVVSGTELDCTSANAEILCQSQCAKDYYFPTWDRLNHNPIDTTKLVKIQQMKINPKAEKMIKPLVPANISGNVNDIFTYLKQSLGYVGIAMVAKINSECIVDFDSSFKINVENNLYIRNQQWFIAIPALHKLPKSMLLITIDTFAGKRDIFYEPKVLGAQKGFCYALLENSFWTLHNNSKAISPLVFSNFPKTYENKAFSIFNFHTRGLVTVHANQSVKFKVQHKGLTKIYKCKQLAILSFGNEIIQVTPFMSFDKREHCILDTGNHQFIFVTNTNCIPVNNINCTETDNINPMYYCLLIFPVCILISCFKSLQKYDF